MYFIWGLKRGSGDFFVFETVEDAWKRMEQDILPLAFKVGAPVVQYVDENVWSLTSIEQFTPEGYYTIHWRGDHAPTEHHIKPVAIWKPK